MTKQWKDAWTSLASSQLQLVAEFEGLYDPIVGASEGSRRQTTPTPQLQLERTFRLKKEYKELKTELLGEIGLIEEHVIRPAAEARKFIAPVRKTIGKRENKRLAYEKLQDKAIKIQRKPCRTTKDEAALAKLEVELSKAAEVCAVHQRGRLSYLGRLTEARSLESPTSIFVKPCRRSSWQPSISFLPSSQISSSSKPGCWACITPPCTVIARR